MNHKRKCPKTACADCQNCGEVCRDAKVTRTLRQQADWTAQKGVEIDVQKYAAV